MQLVHSPYWPETLCPNQYLGVTSANCTPPKNTKNGLYPPKNHENLLVPATACSVVFKGFWTVF